jgi:hypothetical protein
MNTARRVAVLGLVLAVAPPGANRAVAQRAYSAQPPVAITSCGQSSDAFTLSLLSKRVRLDHTFGPLLKVEELRGVKTLVIVVGGSLKGLVEAGMDQRGEMARVNALLAAARQSKVAVIAVHLGGESRRGSVSDPFIDLVIRKADYLVVTEAGNKDGLFTKTARTRGVPLVIVAQSAEVARELKALFPSLPGLLP